jgi:sarcosine oxidase subunit beta
MSPNSECDLLVIGGGITGLSLAVHAARQGLRTTLVEAASLGGISTQRSGALVRTHYDDRSSAALALRGLELFETFEERYGGPSGFTASGFVYVPVIGELGSGAFTARLEMLRGVGVETEAVDPGQLAAIDPAIDISDSGIAAFEPRSGFADPALTTATLARAAADAGAELLPRTAALRLLADEGRITGATVQPAGELPQVIEAGAVALCCGSWAPQLAGAVGVDLPIRPTAVKLAFIERRVPQHLAVIDAPWGTYMRQDPGGTTLVGRRTWTDEPLEGPDSPLPEIDGAFLEEAATRLAKRIPSAAGAAPVGSRAGMLDMTPDGLPFVGPALRESGNEVPGLWLCCGWSGTGFKTGPPVGEALAEWIATGSATLDLSPFSPGRSFAAAAATRSPH